MKMIIMKPLKLFSRRSVLGEREFITQQPYEYKVRALKFTQMAYIDYEDFINVISENDTEYEIFCMKRDRLLFNPQFKGSGNVCEICEWTHNFIQQLSKINWIRCPFVFLQPNFNKISSRFTSVRLNNRIKFPYRNTTKSRTKECLNSIQEGALKIIVGNLSEEEYTDEYLISLGFQLTQNMEIDSQNDDESSKNLNDSQSPTITEKQRLFQKKCAKTMSGVATMDFKDVKETHDLKKSIINFQRIQFGKEKQKGFQVHKKEQNENGIEVLEQSQLLVLPNATNARYFSKQFQGTPRRSSNFDEFGSLQLSQKSGNFTSLLEQEQNKLLIKQISKNSESSEMQESLIRKQIENQERRLQGGGEQRRKKRKTTIQLGQKPQRKSYQHQQSNLSPVLQQQFQKQQLPAVLDQKLKRQSIGESRKQMQTNQITSVGQIEMDGEYGENIQDDSLQQKILDIVHSNENYQVDCCKPALMYFPEFNIEVILKKIEYYYLFVKGVEKKMYKRSKSSRNLFERIKPSKNATIKSYQNNSRSQGEV
ncbi:unnamed protein product (macronuclear) [Paramecium tetraurelia]|uniref:Cyclic nucleotide-binding domain-containing protein n=1 Tax=Paramecium tetraurelia TaxID=5888 RepID=A0BWK7_PARTE|nr:uncharacterized protein GSPATT00032776001 [Paramecium tetraurelia]CAK62924.1 unnamed protein product [Paramecium tetraurelia]|eukprot:XP_001430322.1 hypothetical protein (macronuclear) [Paramecium tetraurelia strain d4-2]